MSRNIANKFSDKIISLVERGFSAREVGEIIKCSSATIIYMSKKLGVSKQLTINGRNQLLVSLEKRGLKVKYNTNIKYK